jgi:hypothetical protein
MDSVREVLLQSTVSNYIHNREGGSKGQAQLAISSRPGGLYRSSLHPKSRNPATQTIMKKITFILIALLQSAA